MRVLVLLPTYNERENIGPMIEAILNLEQAPEMKQLGVERLQIVVVDDSSPDGTGELVAKMADKYPAKIHLIRRQERGRGTAGIAGFRYALTQNIDCLVEMDADFSHDPAHIPRFLREVKKCQVVIGSRFVADGQTGTRGPFRKVISWGAGFYARLVLGIDIKDWHGGYKCYRKEVLSNLNLNGFFSKGYSIGMETLYRLLKSGCSCKEIPILFRDRIQGESKFSTKEILDYIKVAWRLRCVYGASIRSPKKGGIKFPASRGITVSYDGETIIGDPKEDEALH